MDCVYFYPQKAVGKAKKTYLAQKFDIFSRDFAAFIAIKNGVFDLQADLQPLWFTFHITKKEKNIYIIFSDNGFLQFSDNLILKNWYVQYYLP